MLTFLEALFKMFLEIVDDTALILLYLQLISDTIRYIYRTFKHAFKPYRQSVKKNSSFFVFQTSLMYLLKKVPGVAGYISKII